MFYNLGSIFLGLTAWILGYWYLTRLQCSSFVPFCSFSCCSVSLLFQLLELKRRAVAEDACGFYDTIGAICLCAVVLVSGTLLLHLLALLRRRNHV